MVKHQILRIVVVFRGPLDLRWVAVFRFHVLFRPMFEIASQCVSVIVPMNCGDMNGGTIASKYVVDALPSSDIFRFRVSKAKWPALLGGAHVPLTSLF